MASKRGKKSERTSKTPEVSHVEERPTEKELIPGKGFYERDWLVCMNMLSMHLISYQNVYTRGPCSSFIRKNLNMVPKVTCYTFSKKCLQRFYWLLHGFGTCLPTLVLPISILSGKRFVLSTLI